MTKSADWVLVVVPREKQTTQHDGGLQLSQIHIPDHIFRGSVWFAENWTGNGTYSNINLWPYQTLVCSFWPLKGVCSGGVNAPQPFKFTCKLAKSANHLDLWQKTGRISGWLIFNSCWTPPTVGLTSARFIDTPFRLSSRSLVFQSATCLGLASRGTDVSSRGIEKRQYIVANQKWFPLA